MSEDWFDFVAIGSDTIILYGCRANGKEFHRELDAEEREKVYALTRKQDAQRDQFLRELAR